jgi:hypothetical protein
VRREFNVDVEVTGAPYGRFEVLVDGVLVLEGGPLAALGILPSAHDVIAAILPVVVDAKTTAEESSSAHAARRLASTRASPNER